MSGKRVVALIRRVETDLAEGLYPARSDVRALVEALRDALGVKSDVKGEPSADDMLDTRAAAVVLGVSPKTLNKWRCKGGGPHFVSMGAAIRYRRSALAEYIERRTFSKTAEMAS